MDLKTIEWIQQLEKENERLKKRIEKLEQVMYTETVDNEDYNEYNHTFTRVDDCE